MQTSQQHVWHKRPGGRDRLAFEIARLDALPTVRSADVRDLSTGSTVIVVRTPTPPGYTLYLQTGRDYPHTPPAVLVERGEAHVPFSSRVITTWQPSNTLAQVVSEVVGGAVARRSIGLIIGFGLVAAIIVALGLFALLGGQDRIVQSSAVATAQAYATALGQSSDTMSTVAANATAQVRAAPNLADTPNPTLDAAAISLSALRQRNAAAQATVTAVLAANATATAKAVAQANAQTQSAFRTDQTAQALTNATATALSILVAPTPTFNPMPTTPTKGGS